MKTTVILAGTIALAVSSHAAVTLSSTDFSGYQNDVNGQSPGGLGTFDVDTGATGYIELDGNSLSAAQSGGTTITVSQIGSQTISTIGDLRLADEVGGNTNTSGALIQGTNAGNGYNVTLVPGSPGPVRSLSILALGRRVMIMISMETRGRPTPELRTSYTKEPWSSILPRPARQTRSTWTSLPRLTGPVITHTSPPPVWTSRRYPNLQALLFWG